MAILKLAVVAKPMNWLCCVCRTKCHSLPGSLFFFCCFRFTAEDARYAEFSRVGLQDKIVATYGKVAKVCAVQYGNVGAVLQITRLPGSSNSDICALQICDVSATTLALSMVSIGLNKVNILVTQPVLVIFKDMFFFN